MSSNKMLVRHVRDHFNRPFATIVALAPDQIGLAVCNQKDTYNKAMGRKIAEGSALYNIHNVIPDNVYVVVDAATTNYASIDCVPVSIILQGEVDIMRNRARRYFKQPQEQTV